MRSKRWLVGSQRMFDASNNVVAFSTGPTANSRPIQILLFGNLALLMDRSAGR